MTRIRTHARRIAIREFYRRLYGIAELVDDFREQRKAQNTVETKATVRADKAAALYIAALISVLLWTVLNFLLAR